MVWSPSRPTSSVAETGSVAATLASYVTTRSGAFALLPSKDRAVRSPVPSMRRTTALAFDQPGRSTSCWIAVFRSGVFWAGPALPLVHAGGDHGTDIPTVRPLRSLSVAEKVGGATAV